MTCEQCLENHSELLDARLDEADAARCREHIDRCARCAEYDRVLRRGLMALSGLEQIRPGVAARKRLLDRLRLEGLRISPPQLRAVSAGGRR